MKPIHYFVVGETKKTIFVPLKAFYPECDVLLKGTEMENLNCMYQRCPKNANCAESLANRAFTFFNEVELEAEMMLVYFKHGSSIRAGVFKSEMTEPKVITCNQSAFNKFRKIGKVKSWVPDADFYLPEDGGTIIPVGDILSDD